MTVLEELKMMYIVEYREEYRVWRKIVEWISAI